MPPALPSSPEPFPLMAQTYKRRLSHFNLPTTKAALVNVTARNKEDLKDWESWFGDTFGSKDNTVADLATTWTAGSLKCLYACVEGLRDLRVRFTELDQPDFYWAYSDDVSSMLEKAYNLAHPSEMAYELARPLEMPLTCDHCYDIVQKVDGITWKWLGAYDVAVDTVRMEYGASRAIHPFRLPAGHTLVYQPD